MGKLPLCCAAAQGKPRNGLWLAQEVGDHDPLLEQLWLLLPEGRVRSRLEARHLIRTLRLRLAKVGEELLGAGELPEDEDDPVNRETCQAVPGRPASQNYAPSA